MGVSSNPTNTNLLQASKFLLTFDRLPFVSYFCTKVNLPGIQFGEATQQMPFIDAPIPGDKMIYEVLEIEFIIDEPFYTWSTIQDWIKGMAFPENFQQYANLNLQQKLQMRGTKPQYSDAILTILSNKNNPIATVQFIDVFPISISSINFDTELSAKNIVTGKASFKFTNYDINRNV
jgi:hypothetical protein